MCGDEEEIRFLEYISCPSLEYAEELVDRDGNEEMRDNMKFLLEGIQSSGLDQGMEERARQLYPIMIGRYYCQLREKWYELLRVRTS